MYIPVKTSKKLGRRLREMMNNRSIAISAVISCPDYIYGLRSLRCARNDTDIYIG
jgi:hypothetical protein